MMISEDGKHTFTCSLSNKPRIRKRMEKEIKYTNFHFEDNASGYYNNDAGWVKFTKCKLVHKSDNLYVGQLCTANGLCKQIEVVCDGENMTWSEK